MSNSPPTYESSVARIESRTQSFMKGSTDSGLHTIECRESPWYVYPLYVFGL